MHWISNKNSALNQIESKPFYLHNHDETKVEVTNKKIKKVLNRYHCFPSNNRKEIWSKILQLPANSNAFKYFTNCPHLQQTRNYFPQKKVLQENPWNHWCAYSLACSIAWMWLTPFYCQANRSRFWRSIILFWRYLRTYFLNGYQIFPVLLQKFYQGSMQSLQTMIPA